MNYVELIRGILSVELRGVIFFALALTVVFFLRKRSARVVAACWRAVFAAAMVMLVMGFAKPMMVMELVGRDVSKVNEKVAIVARPSSISEARTIDTVSNDLNTIPVAQLASAQSDVTVKINEQVALNWPAILLTIWVIGMLALLIRPLIGAIGLAKMHRQSQDVAGPVREEFNRACKRSSISNMKLRMLPSDGVPFVAGVLRPTLYVPADAVEWDSSDWEIILRHEVAHVHHFDGLFNLLAQICLAAFWVNPLAWIAYRQLKITQECAADDSVLCGGVHADDYAGALLKFCAKSVRVSAPVPAMAMSMARPSTMRVRIERILDTGNRRTPDRAASRIGGLAMVSLATIIGTTALVHAEKAVNEALAAWTLVHFVEALTEPKAVALPDKLRSSGGWPERYNKWGGKLNLALMGQLLENDLYLSGPHRNDKFHIRSRNSFGHYNPAALDEMTVVLEEVLSNAGFVSAFQPAYDEHLKVVLLNYLRTYQGLNKKIEEEPEEMNVLKSDYKEWISGGDVPGFKASLSRDFNHDIAASQKSKRQWMESVLAAKFWTRRILDGTDAQFLKMLSMVMVKMDPTGPLSYVPENLVVETDVKAVENGFRISLKKSNAPADKIEPWSRIDGGPWVKGATREKVIEGDIKIEWEYRFVELSMIKSEKQEIKLKIEGSLLDSIGKALTSLSSDSFKERAEAQFLLDSLDVGAVPLLEAEIERTDNAELRLGLTRAIQVISK